MHSSPSCRQARVARAATLIASLCLLVAPAFAAPPSIAPLPADRIISILQGNRGALEAAKAKAIAALRQRGLSVSEITDEGLFSEIRADREVRVAVSQQIQALGLDMPAAAVTPPPQSHELSAAPDLTKPNPPVERPHELGMSNPSTAATRVPGTPHEIGVIPNLPENTSAAEKPSTEAPHEIGLIPPPQSAQQPAPATTAVAITPSSSSIQTRQEEKKRAALAPRPVIDDQRPQYPASVRPNLFARNFYQDQKDIWLSPRRIRVDDLNWLIPAAGITAGLISADAELEQRAPDLPLASNGGTLSNAGVAALLGGAGGLFLIGHWQDDAHKREAGILALEAAADSMVVDGALKFITQRNRPLDGNRQGDFFAQSGINSGFPSAHSALAWSSAAVLAHEYPSIWSKIFFYGTAAAVSYSRVAAQHHFPSDVVIGSLAGYLIGQHVYARHHDPQLEGGDYGTFNRSVLPEERSAASIASPYVPMDSWVYPAFDRLIALGAVRSGILGIRPWTRRECARLLEEAADQVDPGGADPVSRMYAALEREFAPEMDYPAAHFAQIDSIYTRVTGISGRPLTDDYHFGRTIVNDYGRPLQEGFNNVTGVSASSSIGVLGFYVRGEYQHAPSGPGLTQTQQDAIQFADAKPLIPAQGPVPAVNDFRLLDTYLSLNLKGWQWSFGKQTLWTSETQDPFLWSDNAEPIWMFRMDQTTPRKLPILGFLGPYRTELWFGRLQGQHFVGSTPDGIVVSVPEPLQRQPFVNGFKINFKPTENFEFGVGKTGVFGGPFFPVTMDTFWKSMFSTGNLPGIGDPGDRRSTFDFSYRIPGLRKYLMIYDDSFVEDEISPLGYPRRSAHNAGLYMPQMPFTSRLDFRFEGGYTNLPHLIEPPNGGFFYWNIRYLDGYTNNGNILGNGTVGRQGISFRAASTYWVASDKTIQVGYRNVIEDSMFAGGGNLRDITLRSEWSVRKNWSLSSLLQYEWWNFPVLTNGNRQNDFTASFQVTYHPHWKIGDAPKK